MRFFFVSFFYAAITTSGPLTDVRTCFAHLEMACSLLNMST